MGGFAASASVDALAGHDDGTDRPERSFLAVR
jgi:hypothetical protein